MSNILVTGAAGFIGSHTCEKLVSDGHKVFGIDNLQHGSVDNLADLIGDNNFSFVEGDVNNPLMDAQLEGMVVHGEPIDYIYHLAATVGVKYTLEHPFKVFKDIEGFKNIFNYAVFKRVKRVFFSSSSEIYGEPVVIPQNEETTPFNARLPYAVVKNMGELYCKAFKKEYGIDYTIFRFFNTYGERQAYDFVVSKFVRAALADENIPVYGDGHQTRSFFYVKDNVRVTTGCIENENSCGEIINVGSDKQIDIIDLALGIIQLTGSKSSILRLPALKEGDMTRRQPDITKMNTLFPFEHTDLMKGLERVIEYEKAH